MRRPFQFRGTASHYCLQLSLSLWVGRLLAPSAGAIILLEGVGRDNSLAGDRRLSAAGVGICGGFIASLLR